MDKVSILLIGVCLGLLITLIIAYLMRPHRKRRRTPPRTHKRTTHSTTKTVPIRELMKLWSKAGTTALWARPAATPPLTLQDSRSGPVLPTATHAGATPAPAPAPAQASPPWPSERVVRAEVQRLQDHLAVATEMVEHLGYGPTLERILAEL